ncbi:MAG: hypothetical protein JEY94_02185 [Melioribacteraceae bacterium]|nr:hypothetical protein [Melioribacteraceae bacterium]
MKKVLATLILIAVLIGCSAGTNQTKLTPTNDDGTRLVLNKADLKNGDQHLNHAETFGKYAEGFNHFILQGIDIVQKSAMDGGGYFIGLKADPPESPIGYDLKLFNKELLKAPRTTSYCSGSSYSAFVEALNLIFKNKFQNLSDDRYEALRMQELDGSRRNDGIKYWGKWNDNGYGNHFALVQYSGMGKQIKPINARPGDFLNISWKSGNGHSVIFLGWCIDKDGDKCLAYWSSQKGTDGLGDQVVKLSRIEEVMFVRLTNPEKLFTFDANKEVISKVKGDVIDWE